MSVATMTFPNLHGYVTTRNVSQSEHDQVMEVIQKQIMFLASLLDTANERIAALEARLPPRTP